MRCIRDKNGRFTRHDIVRGIMEWKCSKCDFATPTLMGVGKEMQSFHKKLVHVMGEDNEILKMTREVLSA